MAVITRISISRRGPNRRRIYLDGKFAFACSVNVVARFRLREGTSLNDVQLNEIHGGEMRQRCLDRALRFLQNRLHAREELAGKLRRSGFPVATIDIVLDELTRLGNVNDERFAQARATLALQQKHQGRFRASADLLQRGVARGIVERVVGEIYETGNEEAAALRLAEKRMPGLRRCDPAVARRRLWGLLVRRGFDQEQVRQIVDQMLGEQPELTLTAYELT